MNSTRALLAVLLSAAPLLAVAQPPAGDGPPHDPGGQHRRGPPPEAVAACQGKAVGTQASFTDRAGRTVSGACTQMEGVVAVPPPAHPPGGMASRPQP